MAAMAEIDLGNGHFVLVDDQDLGWLSQWSWSVVRGSHGLYARRNYRTKGIHHTELMHRAIMGAGPAERVDHVRVADTLDNRRANLRLCSNSLNMANRGPTRANTSGFKGVLSRKGRFAGQIRCQGKALHLGVFDTAEEAARAYDAAALQHFGSFAALNFPESPR